MNNKYYLVDTYTQEILDEAELSETDFMLCNCVFNVKGEHKQYVPETPTGSLEFELNLFNYNQPV